MDICIRPTVDPNHHSPAVSDRLDPVQHLHLLPLPGNTFTTSWVWALVSLLLPRPVKCDLSSARQLLAINVSSNTLLHAFLWAAMIGSCSACISQYESSLAAAWPALVVLAAVAILATFPYYYLTVRHQTRNVPSQSSRSHTNAAFMVSTAL